jgi:hypothetical protein
VPPLAVGANELELAALLAGAQEGLPGGVEVGSGREEFVESAAPQLLYGQTQQPTSGWIGVDENARVVDDEHGVMSGCDQGFGLLMSRQQNHDTTGPGGACRAAGTFRGVDDACPLGSC